MLFNISHFVSHSIEKNHTKETSGWHLCIGAQMLKNLDTASCYRAAREMLNRSVHTSVNKTVYYSWPITLHSHHLAANARSERWKPSRTLQRLIWKETVDAWRTPHSQTHHVSKGAASFWGESEMVTFFLNTHFEANKTEGSAATTNKDDKSGSALQTSSRA